MGGKIRAAAALAAVLAMVGGAAAIPTGASVPGVVDFAVDIESQPALVSPPGQLVLLEVVVSNVGVVTSASEVAVDLPDGAAFRADVSDASCASAEGDVVCDVAPLAPGEQRALDVVAHTPTTAGVYDTTATVTTVGVFEPLEYRDNNTDTTTTTVEPPNPAVAAGVVEGGDTLSLDVGDGRRYTLSVPADVPGVIVERLAAHPGAGKVCGVEACGAGFILKFVEGHPTFQALDPMNPLRADMTFGPQDPCRGLGSCADMYWAPDDTTPILELVPNCPAASGGTAGDGTARPAPCINQRYKHSGQIHFDVRLLSTDPLTVPPLLRK